MDILNGGDSLVDPSSENSIKVLKSSEVNTQLVPLYWRGQPRASNNWRCCLTGSIKFRYQMDL